MIQFNLVFSLLLSVSLPLFIKIKLKEPEFLVEFKYLNMLFVPQLKILFDTNLTFNIKYNARNLHLKEHFNM